MNADPEFLHDRLALEHFLTVLRRLRNDTQSFVENGPEVLELIGGYILFIDPGDCVSGFTASIRFAPPDTDAFDASIAERGFEGGKANLFQFVVDALCEDLPNLKERLPCLGTATTP